MNATPSKAPPRSPGAGDTLSARALKRRGLIKQAVAAVLERVGYRAMKVTDVAAEAGIAVGLFYHYFPDLCAATCEVLTDLVDDLSPVVHHPNDDEARLEQGAEPVTHERMIVADQDKCAAHADLPIP